MSTGALVDKNSSAENPNYVLVTKDTLKESRTRHQDNKRRNKQLKDGRSLSKISFFSNLDDLEEVESGDFVYDPDMADGKPVPSKLGPFPKKYFGKPLDEIDRVRKTEQTFIVVGKRFKSAQLLRFSSTNALFCLSPLNPLRKFMLRVLSNQVFDIFVILTIIVNCGFMAVDQPDTNYYDYIDPFSQATPSPTTPTSSNKEALYLVISEYVFTAIYTCEMVVKILARGFILEKFTYLRDPWNWLDFIVIILAYTTFGLEIIGVNVGNLTVLRSFRVLRALKTISVIPGLKSIINALLGSTKMLGEVLLLTVFVLCIFSLLALQLFMGTLRQKCVYNIDVDLNVTDLEWYDHVQNETNWYLWDGEPQICSNVSIFGVPWSMCSENYTCLPDIGWSPNHDFTNFDNIFWSMLTGFQLITLDYWENVYNGIIRAQGPIAIVFFMMTVMFGSFYLINLMLAVVSLAYFEEMENQGKEREKKAKAKAKESVLTMDAAKLKSLAARKKRRREKKEKQDREKPQTLSTTRLQELAQGTIRSLLSVRNDPRDDQGDEDSESKTLEKQSNEEEGDQNQGDGASENSNSMEKNIPNQNDESGSTEDLADDANEESRSKVKQNRCSLCIRCCTCIFTSRQWLFIRKACRFLVLDPLMDLFITICIILNTVCLALYHHDMDPSLELFLSISNLVFTAAFTTECILKICALEETYFKSYWNVFDFFIVIFSLVELPLQGVKGLSVLRTFRLLRVLKLAQSWATMRVLLSIIANTIGAVANLTFVLIIIIYIFAIIGMQLLGKNYIPANFPDGEVPRWNFVDFPHSMMMVFRILCGEWIEPLYDCMLCNDVPSCMIVIILTHLVGNILILNLFLALLVNSFATDKMKPEEDESRLGLAFAKLKRWFMAILNCCLCGLIESVKRKRQRNKIGDSDQQIRNGNIEKAKEAEENPKTTKNGVLNDFVVVNDVEEDKLSTVTITNDKILPVNITNENGDVKEGNLEMTPIYKIESNVNRTNGGLHPNIPASNGHLSIHSNVSSRNASAVSLKDDTRPKTPVIITTSTNSETGEMEAKAQLEEKEQEEEDKQSSDVPVEDPVKICCPGAIQRCMRRSCICGCCKDPQKDRTARCWRRIREVVCLIVEHKIFEGFILVFIVASSMTLIFEDIYLDEKPTLKQWLNILNYFFIVLFTIEMLLKWIGLGFKSYFTSFWCLLDFLIVCISLTSVIAEILGFGDLDAFRSLRTLRALRPLRAISRWQGMKIVVNAIAYAIPSIANVLVVCVMFWIIFSIIGVQFFGGTFRECVDANGERVSITIVNNKSDCEALSDLGYTWYKQKINFDDVVQGFVALFQVATFEGWIEVMISAVDVRGVDMQPSREASFHSYIFFVIFIVFGSFFFLNLFIGVIIDNFSALKRKYEGDRTMDVFMTSNQKNYYQTMRKIGNKKPKKQLKQPTNKIQMFFYRITSSTKFEIFIVTIILLNMIAMMVEHYQQSQMVTDVLNVINIIFTVIFVLECIAKLVAFRWYYFKVVWNVFDFIVVMFSVAGILVGDVLAEFINPTLLRVFRLFRIGRILRLVKSAKGIRKLLFALVISLPALVNIGCLLFLVIFIYSMIGMSQFGHVQLGGALDDVVNFRTWPNSMFLLFRIATSAGWNDILEPLMVESAPECDPTYMGYSRGNCGSAAFAVIFFLTFLVISFLVIINTYIAVILENFTQAHAQEEVGITEDDFGMFYQVWEKYDPNASQFIDYDQLSDFCDNLDMPLRLAKPNQIKIASLDLPIYEDCKLHCLDVLFALTKRVLGDVDETEEFKELQQQMQTQYTEAFPDLENIKPTTTTMQINKRITAVKRLQRAWRLHKLKMEIAKAAMANRGANNSKDVSRIPSARSSIPADAEKPVDTDCGVNSNLYNDTLQLPSTLGIISRGDTPTIQQVEIDGKTMTTENKGGKYQVEKIEDVPTIDASVEIINENVTGLHRRNVSARSRTEPTLV